MCALAEALALRQAAQLALAEAEGRWRRELGASAQERNRLRNEIKELKEKQQSGAGSAGGVATAQVQPSAKRARLGEDPPGQLGRLEAYARYHAAEAAQRAERDRADALELDLSRLLHEVQAQLPVHKERATRLTAALKSNEDLSSRLGTALRDIADARTESERRRIEVRICRWLHILNSPSSSSSSSSSSPSPSSSSPSSALVPVLWHLASDKK